MHTQQSFANAIGSGTFPCITRSWLFWFFCPSNHKHALIPLKPWLFCLGEKQKEIIYFTVEIGSFYVNVKSAGEKWTRANFHHHCLVVSLLPTVHINNRNIYFITFLHLFINCPALFPFITILNMQKNANGNRDVSVRKDWTVWCLKKQQNKNQKKTQNTPILKALSPSKSTFPSRSFTFPHLSPSESVFLQPSSSLNFLFFFHKFPPVYPPINFPLPSVSSSQPIHSFSHISHPHSFHWPNLPCLCLCPGCVCERVCVETLTCPSGTLSRATLCPSCCRCSRSCRRCTGSPGTGAWGWTGRWRARSSGCSSARWSGAAWRGWSICCLPPPAPASSRWNRESERERKRKREKERERDRMRGGRERERGGMWAPGWEVGRENGGGRRDAEWMKKLWQMKNWAVGGEQGKGRRGQGFGENTLLLHVSASNAFSFPYADFVELTWWLTFQFARTCHAFFFCTSVGTPLRTACHAHPKHQMKLNCSLLIKILWGLE